MNMRAIERLNTMNMTECAVDNKQVNCRDKLLDFLVNVIDSAITLCQNFEYSGKFNIIDKKKDDYKSKFPLEFPIK